MAGCEALKVKDSKGADELVRVASLRMRVQTLF